MHGDRQDFLWVNHLAQHTGWLHPVARDYAVDGVGLFAVLLLVGVWTARGTARDLARALLAGGGVLLAVALNQPLVHAVDEQRPFRALPHVLLLVHASTDGSFPSDHATMAGATAAGLWFVHRRVAAVATVAALLMAFDRVYVGAHYPVDVLAGLVLGSAVAAAVQVTLTDAVARGLTRVAPALQRSRAT